VSIQSMFALILVLPAMVVAVAGRALSCSGMLERRVPPFGAWRLQAPTTQVWPTMCPAQPRCFQYEWLP